jgi:hypothetical protein
MEQTQSADHDHVIRRKHVRGQSLPLAMNPVFNIKFYDAALFQSGPENEIHLGFKITFRVEYLE